MKVLLRHGTRVAAMGALMLAFAASAFPQVTTGTLYGRVLDPSGGVLEDATVTATNVLTTTAKSTVTNLRGEFTLPFLTVGTYTVAIRAPGFKTRIEEGLEISSGQRLGVDYTLEIGVATESLVVAAESPILNTRQGFDVNSVMVAQLPTNRRDITGLLGTGTGTAADVGGGAVSFNGLAPRGFTFTVDGVDASPDSEFPSTSLYGNFNYIKAVSLEAVEEVQISKDLFSAEIGMSLSGNVNLITKGGSNAFHGSTFWTYQSGGLNAENFFTKQKVSEVFHQFGGSLGGPVIRDKLFFFGVYEGYRLTQQQPQSGFVPSRWLRDQASAAIPTSAVYWDLWPLPTGAEEPGDLEARYIGSHASTRDDNHFVARLDYNISPTDFVNARYTRGRPNYLQPRIAIGNPREFRGENENFSANYTRVWAPTVTSELRFGYNRSAVDRVDLIVEAGAVPIAMPGIPSTAGELFIKNGSNWNLQNTWSWVTGRHSIKLGGSFRSFRASRINEEQPNYGFDNLEDLLANQARDASFQFALEEFLLQSWDAGVFFQDDIRVSPSLQLNVGLRWDYSAVPKERDGRIFNRDGPFGGAETGGPVRYRDPDSAWNANYDMFSPRLGFSWSMNPKTVIRGGAGIFYIPFNLFAGPVELVKNSLDEPVAASFTGAELLQYGIRYPDGNDVVKPLAQAGDIISDTSVDADRGNPYSIQWTLAAERQLTDTVAFDVAYVGNHGVRLSYSPQINRIDRDTGLRPVAGFGQFRHYSQEDSTTYHSLQTSLRRRFADNFGFRLNYTYSANLSYFQGDLNCCGWWDAPQELDNLPVNRGLTSYHRRHRFQAGVLFELPLGESMLLDGWRMGGMFGLKSGLPLLLLDRASRRLSDRPDFLGSRAADAVFDNWGEETPDGTYQYLDPSMFARVPRDPQSQAQERPGTAGRRFITGPGFWSVSLALSKNLKFERFSLQLRADLFNVFNNTNFNDPVYRIDRSSFGQITSSQPGRIVQFSMRVDF